MYKVECVDSIKGKKITDYKIIAIYNEKIVILKRNRMGVIDIDGNELIPAIYSEIIDCINDCFIVRFKNKYGLVNCNNEAVIDFKYNYLKHLQDSYFQGKFFDDYIIDIKTGNVRSFFRIGDIIFEDNLIIVKEPFAINLLDKSLNNIKHINAKLDSNFSCGLAVIKQIKEDGFSTKSYNQLIDENGNITTKKKYKKLSIIDNNKIMAIDNFNRLILINRNGEIIKKFKIKANNISNFRCGKAIINTNKYDAFIDEYGNITNKSSFGLSELENYYAKHYSDSFFEMINSLGEGIFFFTIDMNIKFLSNGDFMCVTKNNTSILSKEGNVKIKVNNNDSKIKCLGDNYILRQNNITLLLDYNCNKINERSKDAIVYKDKDLLIWKYKSDNQVEITDLKGNTIIPLGKFEYFIVSNTKIIINNELIDLSQEYLDYNYIINIEYNGYTFSYCFSSSVERKKFKIYFEKFLMPHMNSVDNDIENFVEDKYKKLIKRSR